MQASKYLTRGVFLTLFAPLALICASPVMAAPPAGEVQSETDPDIIVTAPKTPGERRQELREFTKQIVRKPRRDLPIARFYFPVCPEVKGLAAPDARAIEARIRENAERLGSGANDDPDCKPTIRVAFMAPAAGSAESWLNEESRQLSHIPIYKRQAILAEQDPVRSWNKIALRDANGQPVQWLDKTGRVIDWRNPVVVEAHASHLPVYLTEITGAAVLIDREAAAGMTLAQLADYATMRSLLGTSALEPDAPPAAPTILSLFQDKDAPAGLTAYDEALLDGLYNARRNATPRRVIADTALTAYRAERASSRNE